MAKTAKQLPGGLDGKNTRQPAVPAKMDGFNGKFSGNKQKTLKADIPEKDGFHS